MKNKLSVWVLFTLTVFAVLAVTGCGSLFSSTQTGEENRGNFGEHTRTPVKDFVSLGLIFTETQLTTSSTGASQGQIFTYQALLKEAQKLGADAIINVVIDKKSQKSSNGTIETWYGSALAIKYTETIRQTETVTVTTGTTTTTTESSSVFFNEGGNANSGGQSADVPAGTDSGTSILRGIRQ